MRRLGSLLDYYSSSLSTIDRMAEIRLRATAEISWFRNLPAKHFPIDRFIEVNRLPSSTTVAKEGQLPAISVLIACAPKDFPLLSFCLNGVLQSSANLISSVSLIIPDHVAQEVAGAVSEFSTQVELQVIPESEVVRPDTILLLKSSFGSRYGWALQQVLRNRFIARHAVRPTLIVDADTVLCQSRAWLTDDGIQLMTPTWEFHRPYYTFLNSLIGSGTDPRYTFVPHHMLIQPEFFSWTLQRAGIMDESDLVKLVISQARSAEKSAFCVIYELYAQSLLKFSPGSMSLERWSNRFIKLSENEPSTIGSMVKESSSLGYSSVSLHSWS